MGESLWLEVAEGGILAALERARIYKTLMSVPSRRHEGVVMLEKLFNKNEGSLRLKNLLVNI